MDLEIRMNSLGGGIVNKKDMTEQDIRTKYITPAILSAGWDRDLQMREEVSFTNGKVIVRRKTVKRGEKK